MPFLTTPVWRYPPDFMVNRALLTWAGVSGTTGSPTQLGRYFIYTENVYGGYRYHMRLAEKFWNWSSSYIRLDEVVEDYWVTPPGSDVPLGSYVTTGVSVGFYVPHFHLALLLDNAFVGTVGFCFQRLPEATEPYWNDDLLPQPANPLYFQFTP